MEHPTKHIIPICAHCSSVCVCICMCVFECSAVMAYSMRKDQVFSWCIAGQSHYSNQSVLSGIERTKYAGAHVCVPPGFKSRLCDYFWPNDTFCTSLFAIFIH